MEYKTVQHAGFTEDLKQAAALVLSQYPVTKAAVFGSFARSEATGNSDIDMLVDFSQPVGVLFFGLKEDLEAALQRPVDLFRYSDMARSDFAEKVMREAETFYVGEKH